MCKNAMGDDMCSEEDYTKLLRLIKTLSSNVNDTKIQTLTLYKNIL